MKKIKYIALCVAVGLFASACMAGCNNESSSENEQNGVSVSVYMPDGAPAMAFASLMSGTESDGTTYTVVNPSLIAGKLTNKDEKKNADVCVLPVTAASKLVGDGTRYQMLGVVTNGNLCVLSKDDALKTSFENSKFQDISYLKGKTVGVMKINDLPGLTFKAILNGYGLEWQELKNDGEIATDKVNLKAIADATAIDPTATDVACYVVAEPAASVQVKKKGFSNVCALETLYNESIGKTISTSTFSGFPQAVMVAKRSLIDEQSDWVNAFVERVQTSIADLNGGKLTGEEIVSVVQAHQEDAQYQTTLNAGMLAADVIVRCAVRFSDNASAKDAVQSYLTSLTGVQENAAKSVGDAFFYFR